MNNEKNILCIYHSHCMDGFTAAWVVKKALGEGVEFHAATHGDPPPDVTGKNVIIVDFSYKREVLLEMARKAVSMLVLDHHKSAEADLQPKEWDEEGPSIRRIDAWPKDHGYERFQTAVVQDFSEGAPGAVIYALFDMERSGAGIAWDFFMEEPRVEFIDHVEDRDLWRFNLANTRAICANIFSLDYTFENWDRIDHMFAYHYTEFVEQGLAIERKHHKDIAEFVKKAFRPVTIGGFTVPTVNVPYMWGSDAAHLLCTEYPSTAFAAYYWDRDGFREFGLRSLPDGMDVSEVAKLYGGGGHKHAAGFKVPFGHELAR